MSTYTMKLLKCPACGGPMDTPSGQSSMRCPYCGNAVVIPESLRKPDPNQSQSQGGSLLSGVSTDAVLGYGAQWAEVVRLAKLGQKDEALKQYLNFTNISEADARHTVDALASAQTFEFNQGMSGVHQVYPNMMADAMGMAKTSMKWSMWLGCGITAFVMIIILITVIPILIGVFASLWATFN